MVIPSLGGCVIRISLFLVLVTQLIFSEAHAQFARFAYVVNSFDNTISQYTVDGETGLLRHNGHVMTSKFPSSVLVHPSGKFVYAIAYTADRIAGYRVDGKNGRLTPLTDQPFKAEVRAPFWGAMHPSGRFILVAGRHSHTVAVHRIDEKTGAVSLIKGAVYQVGEGPRSVAIHPNGRYVYVTNIFSDNVSVFTLDQESGHLKPVKGSPFPAVDGPQFTVATPDQKFVFTTNWISGDLSQYSLDKATGGLSPIKGSPLLTGEFPFTLMLDASGRYLYVGSMGKNRLYGYKVNADTGALTAIPGSPFEPGGFAPVGMEEDPASNRLYISHYDSHNVSVHSIAENGALTLTGVIQARMGARSLGLVYGDKPVEHSSKHAFVLDDDKLLVFALGAANTPWTLQQTLPVGDRPKGGVSSADGRFIYVLNGDGESVSGFVAEQPGDSYKVMAGSPYKLGKKMTAIDIGPNDHFLYLTDAGMFPLYNGTQSTVMHVATIDADSGGLSAVQQAGFPVTVGTKPVHVDVDTAGRFALVSNKEDKTVSVLRYQSGDSPVYDEITIAGSPFKIEGKPQQSLMEASGRFAYVLDGDARQLFQFQVDGRSGQLTPLEPASIAVTGDGPMVGDVLGKRLALVDKKKERVLLFIIGETGRLVPADEFSPGFEPVDLAWDYSGHCLWVLGERDVVCYSSQAPGGAKGVVVKQRVARQASALWFDRRWQ